MVRLPVALLEPFEAEAKRQGQPLATVLAARLESPAPPPTTTPAAFAGVAVVTDARVPRGTVKLAVRKPDEGLNANGHLTFCKCAMCRPKKKGSER